MPRNKQDCQAVAALCRNRRANGTGRRRSPSGSDRVQTAGERAAQRGGTKSFASTG